MRRTVFLALAITTLLLSTIPVVAVAEDIVFTQGNYYVISIGAAQSDVGTLVQTGQAKGFAVIISRTDGISAYRGNEPTEETEAELVIAESLLYVDGSRFLLRLERDIFDYEVRPGTSGYDLVLIPHQDMTISDLFIDVLTPLQNLGIIGDEVSMEYQAFILNPEKSEAPPTEIAIDSKLYNLMIAPDWLAYAKSQGLERIGLRITVVAEKTPTGTISDEFQAYLVSETDSLAKFLLPIEDLVRLASDNSIDYLRPPYYPQPAAP